MYLLKEKNREISILIFIVKKTSRIEGRSALLSQNVNKLSRDFNEDLQIREIRIELKKIRQIARM